MKTEELDTFASKKLNIRHYTAIKDAVEHDHRLRVEIRAFKRSYHALINTGSMHSFIRQDIVKKHNIPFTKIVGNCCRTHRRNEQNEVEFEYNITDFSRLLLN
jgi:hypothetical protein